MRSLLGRFHRPMSRGLVNNMLTMNNLGDGSTLSLDFTTMGDVLDPRLTFTRSTTATYINSSGYVTSAAINAPRFDYSPTNIGEPRGLLIEGQTANITLYSEKLNQSVTNVPWYYANLNTPTVATGIADPYGNTTGTTAWKLVATGTGYHAARQTWTFTAAAYTFSFYAKAAEYDRVTIGDLTSGQGGCSFVLTGNGTATVRGGGTNPQITPHGTTGWYRCSVTIPMTATAVGMSIVGYPTATTPDAYGASYTADGTSGVYVTMVQVELGSGASSYIPTGASQVTRNADECTATGTNFSSWWPLSQSAFTVYWDGDISRSPANTQFYWLTRAGGSSRSRGYVTTGSLIRANSTVYDFTMSPTTSITVGTRFKSAVAISSGSSAMYANNSTVTGSDTSANAVTLFDADSLNFNGNADNFMHIRAFKFYPIRLENTQLQALVT